MDEIPNGRVYPPGRWMAAAVVALLVGGAAGFSYQRYVEPRTMGDLHGYGTVQRN